MQLENGRSLFDMISSTMIEKDLEDKTETDFICEEVHTDVFLMKSTVVFEISRKCNFLIRNWLVQRQLDFN